MNKINNNTDDTHTVMDLIYDIFLNYTPLIKDLIKIIMNYEDEPKIKGNLEKIIGKNGSKPLELLGPRGIASDVTYIYVLNYCRHKIDILDTSGALINSFGDKELEHKILSFPDGLAIYESRLYIADRGNNAIKIFDIPSTKFIGIIECELPTRGIYVYESRIFLSLEGGILLFLHWMDTGS